MQKRTANLFGYASLVCSLLFWVLLPLRLIPGFPTAIDLSFSYWFILWAVGLVLSFVAATGSSRWAWTAVIPLGSFLLVNVLIHFREPH